MKNTSVPQDPLRPRPPDDLKRGALVAVLGMGALVLALTLGLRWHLSQPEGVQAQLWSHLPGMAAPAKPAAPAIAPQPAPPPEPAPSPTPIPEPAAESPKADIEIEHKPRRETERTIETQDAASKPSRKAARREAKAQAEAKAQDKISAQRQENLERIMSKLKESGSQDGGGARAGSPTGHSLEYGARIRAAIVPNITFIEQAPSNQIKAVVRVSVDPVGRITARKLVQSSGFKPWDDAVIKAIDKTAVLPRDHDGSVEPVMVLIFTPADRPVDVP